MVMAKRLTHLSHSQILATLASGQLFTLKSICLHTCHRTAGQTYSQLDAKAASQAIISVQLVPDKLVKIL